MSQAFGILSHLTLVIGHWSLVINFYLFKIHIIENELFILFLKTSCHNFAPRKQRQIINTKKKNYGY